MPKVTIVGAGQVGSTLAMRILDSDLADIILVDIAKKNLEGKVLDLQDAESSNKINRKIYFADDFSNVDGSDIVVITAGFPRKPGMSREDLVKNNALIIKDVAVKLKTLSSQPITIVVTNPVDIMTAFLREQTGFSPEKIIGFGISLDTARFANLIAQELKINVSTVDAMVIGTHGKGMIPLARFSYHNGAPLTDMLSQERIADLIEQTVQRGARIVSCLGNGSAYFAPSAALCKMVHSILSSSGDITAASVYLRGQYELDDVFIGVPVKLGKKGVEEIIELELNPEEKKLLLNSAKELKQCTISV
ncbi:malate dehydrogenase [Candidatus Omnitrophota bacterium]